MLMQRLPTAAITLILWAVAAAETSGSLGVAFSQVESSVASLGKDIDTLKAKLQRLQEVPAKDHTAGDIGQGRTLFMTMCSGNVYFDLYCGPFLASFERAYGAAASHHRVVAFTTNVKQELLDAAVKRFPWFAYHPLDLGKQHDFLHDEDSTENYTVNCEWKETGGQRQCKLASAEEGMDQRNLRTGLNVIAKFRTAASYLGKHGDGFQYAVVMDSDELFVKPLTRFLPARTSDSQAVVDWDVAFTFYDKQFTTPWAKDASDVGKTQKGFVRVNCGVFLVNLEDLLLARRFLNRWAHVSELICLPAWLDWGGRLQNPEDHHLMWQFWQETLMDDFRGNDPAGLALLLSSYDTANLPSLLGWNSCKVCKETVTAEIGMYGGEGKMPVRFRGFPARILNHAESMASGTFPEDLLIVHLKGTWWRILLSNGFQGTDATRTPEWNRDAMALHRLAFYEWQFALPPALRAPPKL